MRSLILISSLFVVIGSISCKKDNPISKGIPTIVKGNVRDSIRGISISGYKVVLIKEVGMSSGGLMGMQGTRFENVAEAYTDNNGDYSMSFDHNLEPGQKYYFAEQYYGIPYYHESSSGTGPIVAGGTNIVNMNAWKPVELKLNVQVTNNNFPPLRIRNELASTNKILLGTESVHQQNISGTYILRSRPNSDINIIFFYYTSFSSPTHQKIIPYRTTLDSTVTLNYTIDCSTF